ncbi:MAG TPA: hypothetical protein VND93_10695, partial [Myxococcales bacterium]|nr:hypothetical protein [Myxococcales bacterium]
MPTKKPAPKQKKLSPSEHLDVAKAHLQKVQAALDDSTDWSDLMTYGFYCMEACVLAAAGAAGLVARKTHWDKQDLAETLSHDCGLPEAVELLRTLN